MNLPRQQLERSLKETIHPQYLLIGQETYLRDEAARLITNEALHDTLLREFNDARFDLSSADVHEAIAAARQLPMMSTRRVVRITDFGRLREFEEEVLIGYLEQPVESSVVIFIAADLDKRKKLTKALFDHCVVVEFAQVNDAQAKAWARAYVRQLSVAIDERVLSEVIALVGTDIQMLCSELDKLATAALGTGRITSELIAALIGRSRELSNFELADHLIARNRKKALEILHRLLQDGAEPVMLIGLIASNYHRLALARDLLTRGGKEEVFRAIRMPSFKQNEFLATVQRTSEAGITRGLQRIAAVDLAIKTSQATPRLQLEMLVCELAG